MGHQLGKEFSETAVKMSRGNESGHKKRRTSPTLERAETSPEVPKAEDGDKSPTKVLLTANLHDAKLGAETAAVLAALVEEAVEEEEEEVGGGQTAADGQALREVPPRVLAPLQTRQHRAQPEPARIERSVRVW